MEGQQQGWWPLGLGAEGLGVGRVGPQGEEGVQALSQRDSVALIRQPEG